MGPLLQYSMLIKIIPVSKLLTVRQWQPPVDHRRFVRWFSVRTPVAAARGFFREIKDNIVNKPLKNYIILKLTINYNYL